MSSLGCTACGWFATPLGTSREAFVMRSNCLSPSVWIVAACTLVAGCATQGSQGPPVAYGYRAGPDFSSANGAPVTRAMPGVAREMHQDKELVQFPSAFATGEIIVSFADRRLY